MLSVYMWMCCGANRWGGGEGVFNIRFPHVCINTQHECSSPNRNGESKRNHMHIEAQQGGLQFSVVLRQYHTLYKCCQQSNVYIY